MQTESRAAALDKPKPRDSSLGRRHCLQVILNNPARRAVPPRSPDARPELIEDHRRIAGAECVTVAGSGNAGSPSDSRSSFCASST